LHARALKLEFADVLVIDTFFHLEFGRVVQDFYNFTFLTSSKYLNESFFGQKIPLLSASIFILRSIVCMIFSDI
jgi:hypothetical protein